MEDGWVGSSDSQRAVTRTTRQPTQWDEVFTARKQTWAALESDFRARVASGEVVLEGLQTAPTLARNRMSIPAAWAAIMRFKVRESIVIAEDTKFIGVMASPFASQANATPTDAPKVEVAVKGVSSFPRRSNRENYTPLIEEALRARWDDVAARVALDGGFIATQIARMLEVWIKSTYPERINQHLPTLGTIRTRLPKIYDQLLAEKAVQ